MEQGLWERLISIITTIEKLNVFVTFGGGWEGGLWGGEGDGDHDVSKRRH